MPHFRIRTPDGGLGVGGLIGVGAGMVAENKKDLCY